jgi:hypothetical protein
MADPPAASVASKPSKLSAHLDHPIPSAPAVPSAPAESSLLAMAPPPPPPPAATGLLTRAAKRKAHAQMVEVPSFSSFIPPGELSTAAGSPLQGSGMAASSDDTVTSSDEDMPETAAELPPGVPVPEVHVQMASPPRNEDVALPVATGNVLLYLYSVYC